MRRVKPWIQHTAAVLAFTNLMLIVGHIEWWDPERGRHLDGDPCNGVYGQSVAEVMKGGE